MPMECAEAPSRIGQRAAAADLDLDQHLAPLLGIDGLERDDIGDGVVGGRHALRDRLVECAEQHGRETVADGDAMHHGRGRRGVHAGARRRDDLDRAVAAGVGGHGRVGRRHQRVEHGRAGGGEGGVARAHRLRAAARQIDGHLVARHRHLGVDADRLVGDAVVVDLVLELVGAVGDAPDHGAHAGFRGVENLLERPLEARLAQLGGEPLDAGRAHLQRGELRLQVAPQQLRLAHVLQDGGAQGLVELAGVEQLHRRDAQALLEDLDRAGAVAAGRGAADIEVVAQRADEADAPAFVEHRPVGDDVGQMLAAAIGIVGDDDIVGPPLFRGDVVGEDLGEEAAHRVEVARDARRLRHVPAVAVEDGGGVVEQLAHDGRAAGAPHGDVHLGGGRGQRVVDDLELDGRDVGGSWSWLELSRRSGGRWRRGGRSSRR